MKKILIFTAGFGEGHNTAARSLCAAVEHVGEGDAEARVVDLFAECYGQLNDFMRKAYLNVINHTPQIWQWIYQWLDRSTAMESNLAMLGKMQDSLEALLEREKPDAVVSTYPVYNYLFDRIYSGGKARPFSQITIVTDSITINSVWYRGGSDYYIVPNEDTAVVMRKHVDDAKIKALGFPVTHEFSTKARKRPAPGEGNNRVLCMINSGKDEAPNLVRRLLELPDIQVTVTVGRDEELRAAIEQVAASLKRTVEIHGWTKEMPRLLMENHVLVSKAGGATVQETIAAQTPMLILKVVPGQEEGNAQLLLGHGCGALTETTDAIVEAVASAFENGAEKWLEWQKNIAKLSKPDAALVIARFVLGLSRP